MLKQLNLNKTIFWIGAGISVDEPTGLPKGDDLTKFYIEQFIGEYAFLYIVNKWEKANAIIKSINSEIDISGIYNSKLKNYSVNLPRLEFIIDCVDSIDIELKHIRAINGFRGFVEAKPNINHYILSDIFTKYASMIITANFDCCIEKCITSEIREAVDLDVPAVKVGNKFIYHYHGLGNNPDDMGATIKKIKRKLPEKFTRRLRDLMSQDYNIIFLGFSCSDFFDVTPFFENMPKEKYNGKAIYFNFMPDYSGEMDVDKSFKEKLDSFLNGFSNKYIVSGSILDFFRNIADIVQIEHDPSERDLKWESFFYKTKSDLKERIIYIIKLFNQIGINLPQNLFLSDWGISLKNYSDYATIKKNDIFRYVADNILKHDLKRHVENNNQLYQNKNFSVLADIITFFYRNNYNTSQTKKIIRDFNMAKQKNPKEIYIYKDILSLRKDIDKWNLSIDSFCKGWIYSIYKHIRINLFLNFTNILKKQARQNFINLKACIDRLLLLNFNDMPYISYYIDLMHYKWIIDVILEDMLPNEKEINRVLEILTEICNMDYIVKHYRWFVYILLIKHSHSKKTKEYNYNSVYYNIATQINKNIVDFVKLIDDYREQKKNRLTKLLIILLK